MKYKIEVHSQGYEDTFKIVDVSSMAKAKQGLNVQTAIVEWCDHNAIDLDGHFDFPFIRVTKVQS